MAKLRVRLSTANGRPLVAMFALISFAASCAAIFLPHELTAFGVFVAIASLLALVMLDAATDRRWRDRFRDQDRKLDVALNNMSQGLCMFDASTRLVLCNECYLHVYGLSDDSVKPGCTLRELLEQRRASGTFSGDSDAYVADLLAQIALSKTSRAILELSDGRVIELVNQPLSGGGWVATHNDISEQRRHEKELAHTRHFLDLVIDNVPAAIVVKNARDFTYVLINREGESFYGIPRQQMIGKTTRELFPKAADEFVDARDRQLVETRKPQLFREHAFDTPHRGTRITTSKRLPVLDEFGEPQYLLAVIQDVTEQKQAQARIAYLSRHDSLTDLPNRVAFNEAFTDALARAGVAGEQLAVLCVDLDRFNEINDVFGHAVGDALIRSISQRLRAVAKGNFLARVDGDRFVFILADDPMPTRAISLADWVLAAVSDEFDIHGHKLRIGLSVGVAIYPGDGIDQAALLGNAEAALHRAKATGGSSVRFFEADFDRRLRERRALAHELHSAIAHRELLLHVQPQAMISGEIIGFEALLRWRHPKRGILSPTTFVPVAEETGLILKVGEWILREACREATSWPKRMRIAVNVSPIQFRHGDLVGLVHSVLLETGLPARRLELEITESVLVDDFIRALAILRRLKALGVGIVMDDFGTGYSSLQNLQAFPFDKLKIDQSFIFSLESNRQSATIVRAVIALGHGLNVPVIAEGVERQTQLDLLKAERCDEVQGFLIGRPQPVAAYAELLNRHLPRRKPKLAAAS